MAPARRPRHYTIDTLAKQLGQVGAFDGDRESLALFFPQKAVIHGSALTILKFTACARLTSGSWGSVLTQHFNSPAFGGA